MGNTDELKFRNLKADEIEVRVGQVDKNKKWISLLLYQDSRVAMDLLDETVGKKNWQRMHLRDNKNCIISIWDNDKKCWVQKEDTGVESFSDKEKGLASDSFKRSAVNWGIGRSLYSSPKMFLYGDAEILKNNKYFVRHIAYDENDNITELVIVDKEDKEMFRYPKVKSTTTSKIEQPIKKEVEKTITLAQQKRLFALANGRSDVVKNVITRYNYEKTEQIKASEYEKICTEVEAELTM